MTISSSCGSTEEYGDEIIVPVENTFTGRVGLDPDFDAAGLELLLAMIDGYPWPLQVCGDTGVGGQLDGQHSDADVCADQGAVIGEVTAHACVLDCDYLIDTETNSSQVIVGLVDGQWNILRVRASPIVILGGDTRCRCCGIRKHILLATIRCVSPGFEYLLGTQFRMRPNGGTGGIVSLSWKGSFGVDCGGTIETATVILRCNADANSNLEVPSEWGVTICGETAAVAQVECDGSGDQSYYPYCPSGQSDGSGSGSGVDRDPRCTGTFITITTVSGLSACCDLECTIDICATEEDPCAAPDEELEEVIMEACGLPNLAPGTRVIMAHIPGGRPDQVGSGSGSGDPVEWFMIRACDAQENCKVPCDPDGESSNRYCCGVLCENQSPTLTATVELLSGSCVCPANTTFTIEHQYTCLSDTRWLLPASGLGFFCGGAGLDSIEIKKIELLCGTGTKECAAPDGSGSDSGGPTFSLAFSTENDLFTLDATTACCDPLFLEFTGSAEICLDAMSVLQRIDIKVTITE